jgi:uncharacterized protein
MNETGVSIKLIKNKGKGLFANNHFLPGQIVVSGKREKIVSKRTNYSFQINFDTHIQMDTRARSMNHSCDPNTGVRNNMFGGYDFIALRIIVPGEEVTWDYETTEFESISVSNCFCQTNTCRKSTKGFKFRQDELLSKYGIYLADYIKFYLVTREYSMLEKRLLNSYY